MPSTEFDFTKKFSFETRLKEAQRIRAKYPGRVPVICELAPTSTLPLLDKSKYLVPGDLTLGQFSYVIRKRIKLKPEQAIFVLVNNSFPSTSTEMDMLYAEHKSEDQYLYVRVSGENTFG